MHYLLAMEHVERLARDIRRNEQHLLEANIHHKNTIKVNFRIIEKTISIITYPTNINNLSYNQDSSIEDRFSYVHYLSGHHPTDKQPIYISRYENKGVVESTVSCDSMMVHTTLNNVLCTDPYVERHVIADPLVIDCINRTIDEIHKTLLFISPLSTISNKVHDHDPIYP